MRRKNKRFFFTGTKLFHDRNNVRNHIPRLLQYHGISDTNIEAFYLIFIMERRSRNHRPRDKYWTKLCDWCDDTSASDLKLPAAGSRLARNMGS